VLNALTIDQQLNTHHDVDRELIALGASNMVVGLFGGLPLVLMRTRALATQRRRRGRRAAVPLGAFASCTCCASLRSRCSQTVLAGSC